MADKISFDAGLWKDERFKSLSISDRHILLAIRTGAFGGYLAGEPTTNDDYLELSRKTGVDPAEVRRAVNRIDDEGLL